jgi:ParB family chromosome partitioning protein
MRKKLTETQQQFIKTGVAAPLPETVKNDSPYIQLPLSQLESWQQQPRQYFSHFSLELLAKTLKEEGIKHPLLVRAKKENGDRYEVIAGERRFQAARLAQLDTVPVLIKELDDQQALEAALSENLHREDLNPVEVLDSILKLLMAKLKLDEDNICSLLRRMKYQWEKLNDKPQDINIPNPDDDQQILVQQALEQYGYTWYSFTCNYLKLKDIPEDLYEAIAEGRIEYSKGLLFHSIKDKALRTSLLAQAIAEGWTQAEIQRRIREKLSQLKVKEKIPQLTPQQQLNATASRLKKLKPWKEYPDIWKKIKKNLSNIERYLSDLENQSRPSAEAISEED